MKRHTTERKFFAASFGTAAILFLAWLHPTDATCVACVSALGLLWPALVIVQHRGEQAERRAKSEPSRNP